MNKHLWEIEHPYYCSDENWSATGCAESWSSWQAFGMKDSEPELNLLFRWDWRIDEETGVHTLSTYWMQQRKGKFVSHAVTVTEADEPEVRAWLAERYTHVQALWQPFGLLVPTTA